MVGINENIKYLRKKAGYTQEQFAEVLGIKRSLLGAYEEGRADPRIVNLLKIAEVFGVTVDTLISKDVSKLDEEELYSNVVVKKEPQLKVLSITVDKEDKENIELVPDKASAGYLNGYADPEYLEDLPKFKLPVLSNNATYRAFEISGDSMLPLQPGTIIIGKYVEDIQEVKNGFTYVLVTSKEGIVYKRVFNYLEEKNKLFLVSDNQSYSPYQVDASEVLEIWEAKAYLSLDFPDPKEKSELSLEKLAGIVINLQHEIIKIKEKLNA